MNIILGKVLTYLRNRSKLKGLGVTCLKTRDYRNGFSLDTINVCGINENNFTEFLNDHDYALGHPYNGGLSTIIDNKLYLPLLFHDYKEFLPRYFFYIEKGELFPLDDFQQLSDNSVDITSFFDLLGEEHILVLKHVGLAVGKGFKLLEKKGDIYYVNKHEICYKDLISLIQNLDQYIVTEYIVQHAYSSNICSSSLNTMKLICVRDENTKKFFVASAYHRFGCNGNVVDNLGSGNGILYFIDIEKGILSAEGIVNLNNSGDIFSTNIIHPDCNKSLGGLLIPRFFEMKSKVLEMLNARSYLKYVGIDVAITDESFKIIETNSFPSLCASQQRKGFLTDERIKKVLVRN